MERDFISEPEFDLTNKARISKPRKIFAIIQNWEEFLIPL